MKRYISAILITYFLLQLYGCYSFQEISKSELEQSNGEEYIRIKTTESKFYDFRENNYLIKNDSICGKGIVYDDVVSLQNEDFNGGIAFSDIESISMEKLSATNITILALAGVGVIAAIISFIQNFSIVHF